MEAVTELVPDFIWAPDFFGPQEIWARNVRNEIGVHFSYSQNELLVKSTQEVHESEFHQILKNSTTESTLINTSTLCIQFISKAL
jgi:hypothetical protein